jgi:hypothetical protein
MKLSAQQRPITEIEAAHGAAETLLTEHEMLLPEDLAALLSTFRSDLVVIIEDHYGVTNDTEAEV